jgi:hypothetical protein
VNDGPSRAKARRTKAVGTAKRLAVREYLPLASWVFSWFMIGVAIGHADAVRLLAANAFVQAVRHVCTLETMPLFGLRERTAETFRQARRAANLQAWRRPLSASSCWLDCSNIADWGK